MSVAADTLAELKKTALDVIEGQNLRNPTWEEWAELLVNSDVAGASMLAAALLREREQLDAAFEKLGAKIPALQKAFESRATTQARLEYLCGLVLLGYRMTPKERRALQQGDVPWPD